jgi:TonB family protein
MTLILLNTTIKISLIVLAALAAAALLRRQSAAVRHFVLAAALACAAATPAVRLVAPAWQPASRMQLIDRPLAVLEDAPLPATSAVEAPARSTITSGSVLRAAGVVWATGAVLSLLVLVIGFARLSWMSSRATRLVDGPWARAAADISNAFGLRQAPVLLHSDHPSVLGTWGVSDPKVLLPADAASWSDDRIRIVLAHELAHVRRHDWLVQTAAQVLRAVYWFNPLVWLAAQRLRLESEQACDDVVLTLGVEGDAYASELVDLARAAASNRQLFMPAATIARPSSLERRVRAMLNATLNRDPITRSASIAAALILAIVTVLVAGFGVSAQEQFATVSGTVSDQVGRPIKDVRAVLSNAAAQTKNEVKSDASGHYELVGIPAGTYELTFESIGMRSLRREGLSVNGGQSVQVNGVLQIGSIAETITVTSTPDSRPRVVGYTGARPSEKPDPCAQSALGGCIRPPVKIKDVRPLFPVGVDAGSGGVVILEGRIDSNGYVTDVRVLRTLEPAFATSAVEAVSGWEFLPTHLDGQPVDTTMTVTVNFKN